VRFDPELIRNVVERRSDPIGVEGDPAFQRRGGVSEADKIVEDVKKSLDQEVGSDAERGLNATINEEQNSNRSSPPKDSISPKGPDVAIDAKVAQLVVDNKES
jgi:protein phosphatase PTC1